jgi:ribosomal protein S18 acetylase RimI-like enzyme
MLKNYRQVVADCSVFVLTRPTQIIGVLVVDVRKPNLLLENIAVLPACKGQGAGKLLMAFCEDYARETGCEAIELYTNVLMTENLEIYKKLGYQETRRAHEDGFSRVFMRKPVRPAAK